MTEIQDGEGTRLVGANEACLRYGSRGGDMGVQAVIHIDSCGSGGLSESPQLPATVVVN